MLPLICWALRGGMVTVTLADSTGRILINGYRLRISAQALLKKGLKKIMTDEQKNPTLNLSIADVQVLADPEGGKPGRALLFMSDGTVRWAATEMGLADDDAGEELPAPNGAAMDPTAKPVLERTDIAQQGFDGAAGI